MSRQYPEFDDDPESGPECELCKKRVASKTDSLSRHVCLRCAAGVPDPFIHKTPRIGRNDPCSCGSGKKSKKCCNASISNSTESPS